MFQEEMKIHNFNSNDLCEQDESLKKKPCTEQFSTKPKDGFDVAQDTLIQKERTERQSSCNYHNIPLDELKYKVNTAQKKGQNQNQFEENRQVRIKAITNLVFSFKASLMYAAIIHFYAFANNKEDPSSILLGVILIWVFIFPTNILNRYYHSSQEMISQQTVIIIRDNKEMTVKINDIHEGDLIKLQTGDRVPVDCRIVRIDSNLLIDFSSYFCNEQKPREMKTDSTEAINYKLSLNIALQGTIVKGGSGMALAFKTATNSFLSKHSNQRNLNYSLLNPIQNEINSFINISSLIALIVSTFFFLITKFGFQHSTLYSFIFSASTLIAFSPSGIITYSKFAKIFNLSNSTSLSQNTFKINRPDRTLENLQEINFLISDLASVVNTSSYMVVDSVWVNQKEINVSNLQQAAFSNQFDQNNKTTNFLQQAAVLSLDEVVRGDGGSIDDALLKFFSNIKKDKQITNLNNIHGKILFCCRRQFSLAIVEEKTQVGEQVLFIKGETNKIWKMCTKIEIDGTACDITQEITQEFQKQLDGFQLKGNSTIACAKLDLQLGDSALYLNNEGKIQKEINQMTLLGLISFTKSSNQNQNNEIKFPEAEGIKSIIVTAEAIQTTSKILEQAGIIRQGQQIAIDHCENTNFEQEIIFSDVSLISGKRLLNELNNQGTQLQFWLKKHICVFAETDQITKSRLVKFLKSRNLSVAQIIKNEIELKQSQADLTIGTPHLGEAFGSICDVQIFNGSQGLIISSLLEAMNSSRSYINNLKKIAGFTISSQMALIVPILAFIILRLPLAISAIFMILISCITNCIPVIALAKEKEDISLLSSQHQPHKRANKIFTFKLVFFSFLFTGIIASGAGFISFFTSMNSFGFPVHSLFGMASIKGFYANELSAFQFGYDNNNFHSIKNYDPIQAHTEVTQDMPHWNSLFMNNNQDCQQNIEKYKPLHQPINWFDIQTSKQDLRRVLVYCDNSDKKWKTLVSWSKCDTSNQIHYSTPVDQIACYTADALSYGQTAYLLGIILFQFSNLFTFKSLNKSFTTSSFNLLMVISLLIQLILAILIVEIPGIQKIFRTRPVEFWQWGIPASIFSIFVLLQSEIKKQLISKSWWVKKIAEL